MKQQNKFLKSGTLNLYGVAALRFIVHLANLDT